MKPANKKFKFSPGSLEYYKNQAMNMHNIAMGYVPCPVTDTTKKGHLAQIALKEFPVPPELHDCFQSWICQNSLTRFNCFLDLSIECDCYKCKTVLAKVNADITYFEAIQDSIKKQAIETMDVVLLFHPFVELPPMIADVCVPMNAMPLNASVSNVSHFYVDIPETFRVALSMPKLTTVEVSTIASDHRKQEAQKKWMKLIQMTPNTLRF